MRARSRGALRPRFASSFALLNLEGAGKTGCSLHPRSRVPMHMARGGTRAYRAAGAFRPSLRNGFTAYFVLFPENGFLASVAPEKLSLLLDLTPAPRRPNHTTSPYASGRVRLSRHLRPSHLTARS